MQYIKINEYKYFALYENPKTGVKEAFLYTDLNNRKPEKIKMVGGKANRNRSVYKLEEIE